MVQHNCFVLLHKPSPEGTFRRCTCQTSSFVRHCICPIMRESEFAANALWKKKILYTTRATMARQAWKIWPRGNTITLFASKCTHSEIVLFARRAEETAKCIRKGSAFNISFFLSRRLRVSLTSPLHLLLVVVWVRRMDGWTEWVSFPVMTSSTSSSHQDGLSLEGGGRRSLPHGRV